MDGQLAREIVLHLYGKTRVCVWQSTMPVYGLSPLDGCGRYVVQMNVRIVGTDTLFRLQCGLDWSEYIVFGRCQRSRHNCDKLVRGVSLVTLFPLPLPLPGDFSSVRRLGPVIGCRAHLLHASPGSLSDSR